MSDSDGKKTLGLRGGPRAGNVKQSFSHGRSKSVVVETKRKRFNPPSPSCARTSRPRRDDRVAQLNARVRRRPSPYST